MALSSRIQDELNKLSFPVVLLQLASNICLVIAFFLGDFRQRHPALATFYIVFLAVYFVAIVAAIVIKVRRRRGAEADAGKRK
jgi:drug/metabolite transporter (DMT)-like permease